MDVCVRPGLPTVQGKQGAAALQRDATLERVERKGDVERGSLTLGRRAGGPGDMDASR